MKEKDAATYNMKESQAEVIQGDKALLKGRKMDAYKHYLAAVEKCQENHEAHGRLAELLIEMKEYVRAHQHLASAMHYSKKAKYFYLNGKVFYNSQQWEEALNEFKRAATENENEKEPVFFYMMAEMQFRLGDYDAAIASYKEAEKMIISFNEGKIKPSEFSSESRALADVLTDTSHHMMNRVTATRSI